MTHNVFLALGTNLGERERNILEAYRRIEEEIGAITRRSSFFRSAPLGFFSPNEFVNTVICCETTLSPQEVLRTTQKIERDMGRTEKSRDGVYKDRIIDIDILYYDDLTVEEPDLRIPHPRMKERPFVMVPLKEVLNGDRS